MPLYSLLDHWYASDQRNHWFGYWFGHDMFTPPFNGADGKPIYPRDDQGCRAVRRHRPGPVLPHLHDLLRELHAARLPAARGPEI